MANPYALLDIEGEEAAPRVQAPSVPKPAKEPLAPKTAAPKKDQPAQAKSSTRGKDFRGGPQPGRKVYRGDGAGQDLSAQASDENKKHLGETTRGSARARGRGTRGRGARPDRHSQTGRTDSAKQEHQGWGGDEPKRELAQEEQAGRDANAEKDASGPATPADGSQTPNTPAVPAEEEDHTQTYTEYLATKANDVAQTLADKLGLSTSVRQANEGTDDSQWKNAKLFHKDQDDDLYWAGEAKDKSRKRQPKEGKTFIEVEPTFPRPGGDRRGGPRGRGGRGRGSSERRGGDDRSRGGRGGQASSGNTSNNNSNSRRGPNQAGPDLSEAAFPSLS